MPLGYRTIFTIPGDQATTEDLVMEQFNEWLLRDPVRSPRNLNRDLYQLNAVTVFNPSTELIYFDNKPKDGSRTVRARLIENKDQQERWISTLTLHFPAKHRDETLLMYEGDSPIHIDAYGIRRPKWVGRPGLVKRILEVVDARDGIEDRVRLNIRPQVIDVDECEDLFDAVVDHERNWSLLVAASKEGELPNTKIDLLERLTHDSMGVSSSFILTPAATRTFNDLVGNDHAVWNDNLRVYLPDTDIALPLNARNHPIIKMANIDIRDPKRTSFFIGVVTRRQFIEKPLRTLQREFSKLEQSLNDREYEILITGQKIVEYRKPVSAAIVQNNELPSQITEYLKTYDRIRNALGIEEFTDELVDDIAAKIARHDLLAERLSAANVAKADFEFKVDLLREELDDEIVRHSEVYEESMKFRDQIKYLRNELGKSDRAERAWLEVPEVEKTFYPVNFQALLDNLYRLPFILFTGDRDLTMQLDATELGVRSGNAWNELCGLNDYCQAKKDGKVNGGVMEYINDLPNGYRSITKKTYRAKESESVERESRLSTQRLFKVPTEVSLDGQILMFSHFTIAKRVHIHFYEDYAHTGRVYVGRIGNHLDTASTN